MRERGRAGLAGIGLESRDAGKKLVDDETVFQITKCGGFIFHLRTKLKLILEPEQT